MVGRPSRRARLAPGPRAGRVALDYADQIFQLEDRLQQALTDVDAGRMRLAVGISDSLPKLVAYRLLEMTLHLSKKVKLICMENEFDSLLADLALNKLDVVLTDRAVRASPSLRVFSHLLLETEMQLFGARKLASTYKRNFPHSLNGAPLLLPTRNNAIRGRIEHWLEINNVRVDVVGEFDDNALLNTFGRNGMGLFPANSALAKDVHEQFGAVPVGALSSVKEQFYAISNERKIKHPAVEAILGAIHGKAFPLSRQAA